MPSKPSPTRGLAARSPSSSTRPAGAASAAAAEDALLRGRFDDAAAAGLDALAAGGGPVAARGACAAIQALFELGRFDEALPALAAAFGAPTTVPPDVLLLWAALGLDAGGAADVAATLERYLAAATVAPGPAGGGQLPRSAFTSPSPPTSGVVLTVDAYETAARMLAVEALTREARAPDRAAAWVAAGGLAPLPDARRAVLAAEIEAAAAAVAAEAQVAAAAAAAAPPPPPAAPVDGAVTVVRAASDGGGATVALGDGGALLKSASFLAATPERLADLWRAAPAPAAAASSWLPAGVSPTMAAAAVIAAGVAAGVAVAERGAVARAARKAARTLAAAFVVG